MVIPVCVVLCVSWICACRSHWNGCMNVAWCCGCLRNTIVFAAEDCESYWRGCIQAAIVICQQIFAILALLIFLLKVPLKSASKSSFLAEKGLIYIFKATSAPPRAGTTGKCYQVPYIAAPWILWVFNQSGKAHECPKSCVWNVPQCTLSGPCGENGENGSGFSNESSISVGY